VNFRLDEALTSIHERLGLVGLLVAGVILAYALFGRLLRVLGLSVLLLVAAQSWFAYAYYLGRNLRWWVLILVCVRGLLMTPPAAPPGRAGGRVLPTLLAALAITSALWAENPEYTLYVGTSFALSIVSAFVVLWRIMETQDILRAACSGALILALVLYTAGFGFGGWAYATLSPEILRLSGLEGRFSGVLYNANMSGLLAMVVIPVLVATPRTWLGRLAGLRLVALVLAGAALYLSGSRSALVGTALSLLIFALYRFGIGAVLTVGLAAAGTYLVAVSADIEDIDATAVGHITRTKHLSTLSGRVELWEEGLEAVEGRRTLGLGWGASRLLHGADPDEALARGNVTGASNLHSTHIQILVDVGFVGLGLLWLFCLQTLGAAWRLLLQPRTEHSIVTVMVVACFVATLADTFVHGSVLSTGSPSSLIFWSSSAFLIKEADRLRRGVPAPLGAVAGPGPPAAPQPSPSPANPGMR
jgi:O-antigen ligase